MGLPWVVAGVRGGSLAFIMGIYDRLLEAVARVHLGFLVPLLAGIASSVLLLVRPITWLYDQHPAWLFAFFFGLIVGSIALIARHAHWGASGLAAIGVVLVVGLEQLQEWRGMAEMGG
jgi:putative membrane protein